MERGLGVPLLEEETARPCQLHGVTPHLPPCHATLPLTDPQERRRRAVRRRPVRTRNRSACRSRAPPLMCPVQMSSGAVVLAAQRCGCCSLAGCSKLLLRVHHCCPKSWAYDNGVEECGLDQDEEMVTMSGGRSTNKCVVIVLVPFFFALSSHVQEFKCKRRCSYFYRMCFC